MDLTCFKLDIANGIADVVMCGPARGNAQGPDFWRELPLVFDHVDQDERVRVVLLRTEGKDFSFGLDLPAMMGDVGPLVTGATAVAERTRLLRLIRRLQDATSAPARCRKPVIAAVQGWCIGGGVDLIAACDVRLCSADARFSVREVKVAIVADLGSLQRLPRIIGEGHAREWALTGANYDADKAKRVNLVNEVHATPEALLTAARAMAAEMAANPPMVVQGIKQVLEAGVRAEVQQGLERVALWNAAFLQSEDLQEALLAGMQRRPPTFQGK